MNKIVISMMLLLFTKISFAQDSEMAATMRSNGKIYVVVAVCLVVLLGLLSYIIYLDRKLLKIENKNNINNK